MCGIVCAFDVKTSSEQLRPQLLEMSKKFGIVARTGVEFIWMNIR